MLDPYLTALHTLAIDRGTGDFTETLKLVEERISAIPSGRVHRYYDLRRLLHSALRQRESAFRGKNGCASVRRRGRFAGKHGRLSSMPDARVTSSE